MATPKISDMPNNPRGRIELECFLYIRKKRGSGTNTVKRGYFPSATSSADSTPKPVKSPHTGSSEPSHRPDSDKCGYHSAFEYASIISSRLARYRASSAKTVLMFEKDERLASLLIEEGFSLENSFKVTVASDSSRPLEKIRMLKPELLIIEPDISPVDGWSIIKMLKSNKHLSQLPIILMSAKYNSPSDIIAGLEHFGADDYLVKPFPTRILIARAKAVLRRAQIKPMQNVSGETDSSSAILKLFDDDPDAIKSNGIAISPLYRKVISNNTEVHLTPAEFSILYFIMKHQNRSVSRDEIIYSVYDSSREDIFSRVVDRHISEIRRKLGPREGSLIKTVFGNGYMFSNSSKIIQSKK